MSQSLINAMAFDFGLKRIGIAYGQSITGTAEPLAPIAAKDGAPDWQEISQTLESWRPDVLVIGLPLNMDGSISDMSYRARKFANRLNERFSLPTFLCDERLTSHEAKEIHLNNGGGRDFGRESVDGIAAQLMLESWFRQTERIPSATKLEDIYG